MKQLHDWMQVFFSCCTLHLLYLRSDSWLTSLLVIRHYLTENLGCFSLQKKHPHVSCEWIIFSFLEISHWFEWYVVSGGGVYWRSYPIQGAVKQGWCVGTVWEGFIMGGVGRTLLSVVESFLFFGGDGVRTFTWTHVESLIYIYIIFYNVYIYTHYIYITWYIVEKHLFRKSFWTWASFSRWWSETQNAMWFHETSWKTLMNLPFLNVPRPY